MSDPVNHPPHYTAGEIECIDAIRAALGNAAFIAYCRGNAFKYLWRTGLKGDAVEDLEKAEFYIDQAIRQHKKDRNNDGPNLSTTPLRNRQSTRSNRGGD